MPTQTKSPILDEMKPQEAVVKKPDYTDEETKYISGLQKRLEIARDARDQQHDEFDGMNYVVWHESNEKGANSYIPPKKNKEDTNFISGTIRQKLFALLASLINLNMSGDISAFDDDEVEIVGLGNAMEDVILKTEELEVDDEKKLMRYYELLKHGTVFIEEIWNESNEVSKEMSGEFTGKIADTKWVTTIKKAMAKPERNIIPGVNVYLGDITQYEIDKQPFIFTVDNKSYEETKSIYGEWERWDNVPEKIVHTAPQQNASYNQTWSLLDVQSGRCEIIKYQDKWANEFAIIINGVLMTPVGLPFPWGYTDYNITQQNLEPIHAKFAYGKSFVSRIKNDVAILDEMLRMAVLKTQKSFMPPYLNLSGRVLSSRIFMPGKITHGIAPNTIMPINDKESQGLTNSELAMIKEIKETINNQTTAPTFSGQQSSGNPTATEIIELQRQAKMVLGLTVFAASTLEWKLTWLRLYNILKNWFNPIDEVVDEARNMLKNKYRTTSVSRPIEGQGMGKRMVVPTDNMPSPEQISMGEQILSKQEGQPIKLIMLSPKELNQTKLIWQIVVRPTERKTSETQKLLFRAFMADAMPLQPDIGEIRNEFSMIWEKDPNKLFPKKQQPTMPQGQPGAGAVSPNINLPSPEKAAGSQLRSSLMQ